MNWYLQVLKNYAGFSGRARRKEYWMFLLFNIIISVVLTAIAIPLKIYWLTSIYSLAIFIPSLAVSVRRLHDIDKSGWWLLVGLIPFVGFIVLIVFFVMDGTPSDNTFGPSPK